ncbi:MAG: hypothetical protein U0401_20065 [Anaerolineae bacterium]
MVDSFSSPTPSPLPLTVAAHHKHIWATLAGKDAALARLGQQVTAREGDHIRARVALCDG